MKISKSIPIPETRGRPEKYGFVKLMKIGDSVFVRSRHAATVVMRNLTKLGRKSTSRNWKKGYRVWRTK